MNIAFIPARCGSKSIPFKNIKNFCGYPLIYWSLKALQNSKNIDEIYVATDCDEIKEVVENFNFAKVNIFKRSLENATDNSSTESAMLEFIDNKNFSNEDLFILVQATSPLIETEDIDKAFDQFKSSKCDSLLSCVRSKRFFWNESNEPINYDYNNRPRRQDFKGLFMENGALYISSIFQIKVTKNRLSGKISIFEMDCDTAIELDEIADWSAAERLMQKRSLKNSSQNEIKLFLSDVDGTLTDAGMYYGVDGNEYKKFNTRDGKGFELLKNAGIKTGLITSEKSKIVENRAKKLQIDFLYQGVEHDGKLEVVKNICKQENLNLKNIAYIGDDINCLELLMSVGLGACPSDAVPEINNIPGIMRLSKKGGDGVVREFIENILELHKSQNYLKNK